MHRRPWDAAVRRLEPPSLFSRTSILPVLGIVLIASLYVFGGEFRTVGHFGDRRLQITFPVQEDAVQEDASGRDRQPGFRASIGNNRAPVLESATLVPAGELRAGETLSVEARAEDPDGHEVRFENTWWVNGRPLRHTGRDLAADRLAVGDRVEVAVRASDGVEKSPPLRVGPVTRANSLPEITSRPPESAGAARYEYRVLARDVDDARRLYFRLLEGPAGSSMDPLTGQLTWDPSQTAPGVYPVRVAVDDWIGGRVIQEFEVARAE